MHVRTHRARAAAALKGHLVSFFSQINQVALKSIKRKGGINNSYIVIREA